MVVITFILILRGLKILERIEQLPEKAPKTKNLFLVESIWCTEEVGGKASVRLDLEGTSSSAVLNLYSSLIALCSPDEVCRSGL